MDGLFNPPVGSVVHIVQYTNTFPIYGAVSIAHVLCDGRFEPGRLGLLLFATSEMGVLSGFQGFGSMFFQAYP